MNLYLWNYVYPVSTSFHSGGAVMAVAPSIERARTLWAEKVPEIFGLNYQRFVDEDPNTTLEDRPDKVFPLDPSVEHPEDLMIYPDAGCC